MAVKIERPRTCTEQLAQHVRIAGRMLRSVGLAAGATLAYWTVGEWQKWQFRRKISRGETIWIEDLPKPPDAETQQFDTLPNISADLSPKTDLPPRKSPDVALPSYPEPSYPFAYRKPPVSGMVISGLDETEKRRPYYLFFDFSYAWGGLHQVLLTLTSWRVTRVIVRLFWDDRRRVGAVARRRETVTSPKAMSGRVKAVAKEHGAALVGITEPQDEWFFDGFEPSFKYAISIAVPMDREEMRYPTQIRTHAEVFRIYRKVGLAAIRLAEYIRSRGYPAIACTNIAPGTSEVQHVPIAIAAGLGQLGKHNSMITKDYGSNVRLATVLTEMPLEVDHPIDIGVDDFCMFCQICTTNCPPQAIFETKQMVRGEERWFINFDRCAPYFVANESCAICIEVCPWSEPGRGEDIMDKMLNLRGGDTDRGAI